VLSIGAVLAAAGLLPATSPAEPPGSGGLCGIARPVDDLLRCPSGGAGAQPTASASAVAEPQATAATRGQQQIRRIPLTPRYVADLLLVKFAPRTSAQRRQRVLKEAGVVVERRIDRIGVLVVRMPAGRRDAALARLRESPWVATAEKDAVVEALDTTPNDEAWPGQWGLRTVGLPSAWDRTRGSSSVIVAVLDSGVDPTHPDLRGAVLPGFDLVNGDSDATDDHGHGTAVAGIIAARTNNLQGVAGVCWSCSVLPVKVLDADGVGDTSLIAAGIVRAVDAGAHVLNLSLGGPAGDQALDDAVAYAVKHGALVVAATGNNGVTTPFFPAASPGAISVAATDETDRLYPWSNSGPWAALAAPGCNDAPLRGGGYGWFCGTSSAAPVVSGLAALALSARPSATRDDILAALEQTTSPIGDVVSRGRVNAVGILTGLQPAPSPVLRATVALKGSLSTRAPSRAYRRAVGDGPIMATLTFTGSRALALAIRDQSGALVARLAGTSPLQITTELKAGTLAIQVIGPARARKTAFKLTLSHEPSAAAKAPTAVATGVSGVLLSPIQQLLTGTLLVGPQLGSPPPGGVSQPAAAGFSVSDRAPVAASLMAAINRVRRARGLPAVAASQALSRAALAHARALAIAGEFSHDWGDGTPFATWIGRYYPVPRTQRWSAGENLLWSETAIDADDAVTAWLASAPHRRILLRPSWRELGAGIVSANEAPGLFGGRDVFIAVVDFGSAGQTGEAGKRKAAVDETGSKRA
jgi:subtilisin family serine protease/uncharacterized protein YkwD